MMRRTVVAILLLAATAAWAQESQRSSPGGAKASLSQEQPKVLYIVPWQAPPNPKLELQEPTPDLEQAFKPLERDFYRQSLYFRQHLKLGSLADSP